MRPRARGLTQLIPPFAVMLLLAGPWVLPAFAQTVGKEVAITSTPPPSPVSPTRQFWIDASAPIVAGLLTIVTLVFVTLLVAEVSRGGSVAIESSWGGFGGGLGGWRLSPGFVYLLVVIVFGSMASMAVARILPGGETGRQTTGGASPAAPGASAGRGGGGGEAAAQDQAPTGNAPQGVGASAGSPKSGQ